MTVRLFTRITNVIIQNFKIFKERFRLHIRRWIIDRIYPKKILEL